MEAALIRKQPSAGRCAPAPAGRQDIPLGARLFPVIEKLDAMTSDRPYRGALSFDAAAAEIGRMRGARFDGLAVEAFFAETTTLRRMVALACAAPEAFAGTDSVTIGGRKEARWRPTPYAE